MKLIPVRNYIQYMNMMEQRTKHIWPLVEADQTKMVP